VDTNIFLEVELNRARSEECREFLKKILKGEIKAFTTDFALDSIIVLMEKEGAKPSELRKFLENVMFFEGLTIYSLNFVDRIIAAALMEKVKLDFDDAIAYFVMKSLDLKEIVSFDKHFDKISGIKRLDPKDVLER
jgi:predicted nucleic acid-binding protein